MFTSGYDNEKKQPIRTAGWFHEWTQQTEMENDYEGNTHTINRPMGIVETDDGDVHLVYPTNITFK